MHKYRIELENEGDGYWSGTLQKNEGTQEWPEWWGVTSFQGDLESTLEKAREEVRRQEKIDGQKV